MTAARLAVALASLMAAHAAPAARRAPEKGCAWKTARSEEAGLEIDHQRCDYGFRTVDFVFVPGKTSLFQVIKDTGQKKDNLYPVITVFVKNADERIEDAVRRVAFKGLSRRKKKHCQVVFKRLAYLGAGKAALTVVPDEEYAAELAQAAGTDIPEPGCGELGDMPDSLVYFEYHPDESVRRFAFVSAGQDEPQFDEKSLRFLP